MGVLFVESIKRLYKDHRVDKEKIIALHDDGKITDDDLHSILAVETEDADGKES